MEECLPMSSVIMANHAEKNKEDILDSKKYCEPHILARTRSDYVKIDHHLFSYFFKWAFSTIHKV